MLSAEKHKSERVRLHAPPPEKSERKEGLGEMITCYRKDILTYIFLHFNDK